MTSESKCYAFSHQFFLPFLLWSSTQKQMKQSLQSYIKTLRTCFKSMENKDTIGFILTSLYLDTQASLIPLKKGKFEIKDLAFPLYITTGRHQSVLLENYSFSQWLIFKAFYSQNSSYNGLHCIDQYAMEKWSPARLLQLNRFAILSQVSSFFVIFHEFLLTIQNLDWLRSSMYSSSWHKYYDFRLVNCGIVRLVNYSLNRVFPT